MGQDGSAELDARAGEAEGYLAMLEYQLVEVAAAAAVWREWCRREGGLLLTPSADGYLLGPAAGRLFSPADVGLVYD